MAESKLQRLRWFIRREPGHPTPWWRGERFLHSSREASGEFNAMTKSHLAHCVAIGDDEGDQEQARKLGTVVWDEVYVLDLPKKELIIALLNGTGLRQGATIRSYSGMGGSDAD